MLHEAELFVMAELMLVEVLGRIREQDRDIVLPAMFAGADRPAPIRVALQRYARCDARVPADLRRAAGRQEAPAADGPQADVSQELVVQLVDAACAAASAVSDNAGDVLVHSDAGDLTVRDYLLRSTLERSLLAHYVAAYLGSTACPLPEELARPLWELTEPDAATWRELGYFRAPMPLPDHVSWRDRLLLRAGHEPHPLGH